ncbi:MAG: M4 family metallopeptidase [Saprospiraceae bacterium]
MRPMPFTLVILLAILLAPFALNGQKTTNRYTSEIKQSEAAPAAALQAWTTDVDNRFTLEPLDEQRDRNGLNHRRYQINYLGYPLKGLHLTTHERRTGGSQVAAPRRLPVPGLITLPARKMTAPELQQAARQILGNPTALVGKTKWTIVPNAFDWSSENWQLAYSVDLHTTRPHGLYRLYVDAADGRLIFTENRLCSNGSHTEEAESDDCSETSPTAHAATTLPEGTAVTRYSGTRPVSTTLVDSSQLYILRDSTRGVLIHTVNDDTDDGDFFDEDNFWDNFNASFDEVATDVHWGATFTYEFWRDSFNRNSYDNEGFPINARVHLPVTNAFWNGTFIAFGDGSPNGDFNLPLTYIDIVAHEMAHGLTEFSSGLIYLNEPGGLNEAFSDITGMAVENQANPDSIDWLIADESSSIGDFFRNMADPKQRNMPDTYGGQFWQPNLEVHSGSSIANLWFYRLVEGQAGTNDNDYEFDVPGIGFDKAYQIAFETFVFYLNPTSEYAFAADASLVVANELFGFCSTEAMAVEEAWISVGLLTEPEQRMIEVNRRLLCGPTDTIQFTYGRRNIGSILWDFGDGTTSDRLQPDKSYDSLGVYDVSVSGTFCDGGTFSALAEDIVIYQPDSTGCDTTFLINGQDLFSDACAGTLYDDEFIDNRDSLYENGFEGSIELAAPNSAGYVLDLTYLELRDAPDRMRIFVDNGAGFEMVRRYSGGFFNEKFTVLGSRVRIEFETSLSGRGIGFELKWECQAFEVPVADFVLSSGGGCYPFFQLADRSSGLPTRYRWSVNGQPFSLATNPLLEVSEAGEYTIGLEVCNPLGCDTLVRDSFLTYVPAAVCGDSLTLIPDQVVRQESCLGRLYDPGATGDYGREFTSTAQITGSGNGFLLNFDEFDLATGASVTVRSSQDGGDPATVGVFTAVNPPSGEITVNGSRLFVTFTNLDTFIAPGFLMRWECTYQEPPVAAIGTIDTICDGLTAQTDLSSNDPTNWEWRVDGEFVSYLRTPRFNLPAPGAYDLNLIVCNRVGCDTLFIPDGLVYDFDAEFCSTITLDNALDVLSQRCNRTVYDDGGPDDKYSNDLNSLLRVEVDGAVGYQVEFSEFNLQNNRDYLQILVPDGTSDEYVVFREYTGEELPQAVEVPNPRMAFRFTTNGSITRDGFTLTYECLDVLDVRDGAAGFPALGLQPNPAGSDLFLTALDQYPGAWKLSITNALGQFVRRVPLDSRVIASRFSIPVQGLPGGLYYLTGRRENGERFTLRFVKE